MSGFFNGWQNFIFDFADKLHVIIKKIERAEKHGREPKFNERYFSIPPEVLSRISSPEVLRQLHIGYSVMREAFVYAQRIDWLLSGDTDEKAFLEGLDEDLQRRPIRYITEEGGRDKV